MYLQTTLLTARQVQQSQRRSWLRYSLFSKAGPAMAAAGLTPSGSGTASPAEPSEYSPLLPSNVFDDHNLLPPSSRVSFPARRQTAQPRTHSGLHLGPPLSTAMTEESEPTASPHRFSWLPMPPGMEEREGLPRFSRQCFWDECKCYGKYILPVLLLFGVLAILLAQEGASIWHGGRPSTPPMHSTISSIVAAETTRMHS